MTEAGNMKLYLCEEMDLEFAYSVADSRYCRSIYIIVGTVPRPQVQGEDLRSHSVSSSINTESGFTTNLVGAGLGSLARWMTVKVPNTVTSRVSIVVTQCGPSVRRSGTRAG